MAGQATAFSCDTGSETVPAGGLWACWWPSSRADLCREPAWKHSSMSIDASARGLRLPPRKTWRCWLHVPVAVIQAPWPKAAWEGKCLFGTSFQVIFHQWEELGVGVGGSRQDPGDRNHGGMLLPGLFSGVLLYRLMFIMWTFLYSPGPHPPGDGVTRSGLGPPSSIVIKIVPHRCAHRPIWPRQFPQLRVSSQVTLGCINFTVRDWQLKLEQCFTGMYKRIMIGIINNLTCSKTAWLYVASRKHRIQSKS